MKSLKAFLIQQFGDRLISISEAVEGEKKYKDYLERSKFTTEKKNQLEMCKNYIRWFNRIMNKTGYENEKTKSFQTVLKKYIDAKKDGYNAEAIADALAAIRKDKFHNENNFCYVTPEYLLRPNIIEKYRSAYRSAPIANNVSNTTTNNEVHVTDSGLKYKILENGQKVAVK